MPDNLALLDKSDEILNTNSGETQEDCGCPFKKAGTQETTSNAQNVQSILNLGGNDTLQGSVTQDFLNGNTGNDFISSIADSDIGRSLSQVGSGSLSSDGSAYILTEGSDRFTIPLGLLDTLIGGLRGLGGADSITGSESGDIVYGDEGNDRIEGLGGADLLYGGAGNDFLSGGAGQNGLLGGDGADTLQGGETADGVNGNAGDDVIFGAGGDDFLRGGRGNDIVNGEDGDDFVIGDFGNDTLTGGAGQDVFFLRYEESLGSPTLSTKDLADSFFGEEKPTEPSKTNFLPQIRKFLADKTGIPFDFCDQPATTPAPAPTCLGGALNIKVDFIPDRIPYGQTAQYTLTYCDPRNDIDNFLVELDTRSGKQTKIIPVSSSSGTSGTISFGIRNKPNAFGDCFTSGQSVRVSARSGSRDLNSISNFTNFGLDGGLTGRFDINGVCDAELV